MVTAEAAAVANPAILDNAGVTEITNPDGTLCPQ
jgi:hypothetical protein